ncbi:gluconokinase [Streptomyces sp. NPDC047108]|uniref:gluconokinase n=1 Tax=Streptomyces sp. NPDC047108 TaxID=3155025 RepID=UPI00340662D6
MATQRRRTRRTAPLVVVMGVSGSGKTTIGERLAGELGVPYAEADDFHPPENVAKMADGEPLDDADRVPWLDGIGDWLAHHATTGGVVSCSALKRSYRDRLAEAAPSAYFVHLSGSFELIAHRLADRKDHFMPPRLLRTQFADLEPLGEDERGASVPIEGTVEETTALARDALPS